MKTLKKNNISKGSSINSPVPVNKNCDLPPFFNPDYFSHVVVQTIQELYSIPCKLRQDGMVATVVQDNYTDYQLQSSKLNKGVCDNTTWIKVESSGTGGGNLLIFGTMTEANDYISFNHFLKEGQIFYIVENEEYYKYDGQDGLVDPFPYKLEKPSNNGLDNPNYKIPAYLDNQPYWISPSNFGKVKSVNGNSSDSAGNVDIGIDDTLRVNDVTKRVIEFEDGGINLEVIDEEGLLDKRFFAYSIRERGIFQIGTGCGSSKGGWAAPTFFGYGSMKKLNRNNTTKAIGDITAYGWNSLTAFEGGNNGGITSIGSSTLSKFVGTNDPLPTNSYFMTALGVNALSDFLNGSRNTALGGSSGRNLVTGSNNTFTGAASMQDLGEGSNNTAMGYQVAFGLKKGSNNTFIGANLQLSDEEVNDTVIIADGTGKQHFKSDNKGSILPYQTIALINADETGKAIITKEFVDSKISNFKLPTNWESPQQRFSGLVNKSADATYNKTLVVDNNGNMAYNKDVTGVLYNDKSYYLKNRNLRPDLYTPTIGEYAVELVTAQYIIGNNLNGVTGYGSIGIGAHTTVTSGNSVGINATVKKDRRLPSSQNSFDNIGIGCYVEGEETIGMGKYTRIYGNKSVAIGFQNIVGKEEEGEVKYRSNNNVVIGIYNCLTANNSYILGQYLNNINITNCVLLGTANKTKELKLGENNTSISKPVLIVGNGNHANDTSDALIIQKNGLALLPSSTTTDIEADLTNKAIVSKEFLELRLPKPPSTGTYSLKSVDGVVNWVSE